MRLHQTIIIIFIAFAAAACGWGGNREQDPSAGRTANSYHRNTAGTGTTLQSTVARGFDVTEHDGYRVVNVYNPWQGARNEKLSYILAGRDAKLPGDLPPGKVIRTPVRSVICLSTTHIAMLDAIGETESISAVSGTRLVYNSRLRQRIESGKVPDIGYDANLDYEKIVEINPDVILAYSVDAGSSAWLDRLTDLGLTVVMLGEYLETTPLAQAGWLKFVAHLFDKQKKASCILAETEKEYKRLASKAEDAGYRPVVISGLPWRNSWFVPGGRSHFASLVADAGGRYLWDSNRGRENFPVDIESVISRGREADYWINTGTARSAADIVDTDPRLKSLPPFIMSNIYNNNALLSIHGGNDYWESGIVSPHIILSDLISILHPSLMPDHELVYYRKLK